MFCSVRENSLSPTLIINGDARIPPRFTLSIRVHGVEETDKKHREKSFHRQDKKRLRKEVIRQNPRGKNEADQTRVEERGERERGGEGEGETKNSFVGIWSFFLWGRASSQFFFSR